jgi:hypothetical protein
MAPKDEKKLLREARKKLTIAMAINLSVCYRLRRHLLGQKGSRPLAS